MSILIKLATDDARIVADITKRILLGESLEHIWFDSYRNFDYVRILLEKFHVDPNIKNVEGGNTALIFTTNCGYYNIAKLLLDHGADPNIQNEYGYTALIYTSLHGYLDIVKLLLEHGADVNIQNEVGNTALHLARTKKMKDLLNQHSAKESRMYCSKCGQPLTDRQPLFEDYNENRDTYRNLMNPYDPSIEVKRLDRGQDYTEKSIKS